MRLAGFLVEFFALTPLPVAIYDLNSRIVGLKTNSPLPLPFLPDFARTREYLPSCSAPTY